jgi:exopolyphosphatase/guanosine-5'-triphosphate,3'-diphosphate pyrophosphatase
LAKLTAVIDFGSNSVRLVIFERTSRFGFKIVHESKSRVRIGEGAYAKGGVLQSEPMDRAFLALRGFAKIIKAFKARKILSVATSALRDAPNRNLFTSRIKKELGINIKVIDGKKEALLGGIACANLVRVDRGITIDIGGGSTEFALIENRGVLLYHSINIGTVRLKELFGGEENDFNGAREYIRGELERLPAELSETTLIGIGGTLRALSKIIMESNNHPISRIHGYSFNYREEREFLESLLYKNNRELEKIGFKRERLDVIRWGVLIAIEVAEKFSAEKFIASGVGIREGLFLSDILRNSNHRFPENFNPSLRNILDEFQMDNAKISKTRFRIAIELFELLKDRFSLDEKYRNIVNYASKLSEIGIKVDFYASTKNGFYLILNSFIYDLSQRETTTVATLVRYSTKSSVSKKGFSDYSALLPEYDTLQKLHTVIYLSKILTMDYAKEREFQFELCEDSLVVKISDNSLLYMIKEKFEEVETIKIEFEEG